MQTIKLTDSQRAIIDRLDGDRKSLENDLVNVRSQVNLFMTLVFDFNGVSAPQQVEYAGGVIYFEKQEDGCVTE